MTRSLSRLLVGLWVALLALGAPAQAQFIGATPLPVLAGASNPYPGAAVVVDFIGARTNGQPYYSVNGAVTRNVGTLPGFTITRASPATTYAETAAGVVVPFPANVLRVTDRGALIELAATNVVLWNRDLTNAAWTKSNITAAKDQTGPDGVANSASSITATAGNGTALQAVTLGSSARFQTAYVKRITGSGVVQMTMDNGTTWTAVTVTSSFTRVSIPTQTLANPTVGFRLVTSGDAIAVDLVQNEAGTFSTSAIPTTTASVARSADVVSITGLGGLTAFTEFAEFSTLGTNAAQQAVSFDDATSNNRAQIGGNNVFDLAYGVASGGVTEFFTSSPGILTNVVTKVAMRAETNNCAVYSGGVSRFTDTTFVVPTSTRLSIGMDRVNGGQLNGYLRRVLLYPRGLVNGEMASLTQ